MPNVLILSGQTGIGKSTLVANAAREARIVRFDCLEPQGQSWIAPRDDACDVLAIDHPEALTHCELIATAMVWCKQHSKPLWLLMQDRRDLDWLGVELPPKTPEFALGRDSVGISAQILEQHGRRFLIAAFEALQVLALSRLRAAAVGPRLTLSQLHAIGCLRIARPMHDPQTGGFAAPALPSRRSSSFSLINSTPL